MVGSRLDLNTSSQLSLDVASSEIHHPQYNRILSPFISSPPTQPTLTIQLQLELLQQIEFHIGTFVYNRFGALLSLSKTVILSMCSYFCLQKKKVGKK